MESFSLYEKSDEEDIPTSEEETLYVTRYEIAMKASVFSLTNNENKKNWRLRTQNKSQDSQSFLHFPFHL